MLELPDRVIALHFGHKDGGALVRKTYGHPDEKLAIEKVLAAFEDAAGRRRPVPQDGVSHAVSHEHLICSDIALIRIARREASGLPSSSPGLAR